MTLITSKVDVCNLALGYLKIEQKAANIDSPHTNEEITCAQYYDITRQSVLEMADWAFALKRVVVAASVDTPAFGWSYQSAEMPSDFLKLVGVYDSSGSLLINTNNEFYAFENNVILSDFEGPYYIKYLRDVNDVSRFDRIFIINLAYALAVEMSEAFKTSATLLQVLLVKYEKWQLYALSVNGQQGNVVRVNRSPYIESRKTPMIKGYNTTVI